MKSTVKPLSNVARSWLLAGTVAAALLRIEKNDPTNSGARAASSSIATNSRTNAIPLHASQAFYQGGPQNQQP